MTSLTLTILSFELYSHNIMKVALKCCQISLQV